jgi:hypothetical protein
MPDAYPSWTIDVDHRPGAPGGAWFVTLRRQERKYAKRQALNIGQGKTLPVALKAVAGGVERHRSSPPYEELL